MKIIFGIITGHELTPDEKEIMAKNLAETAIKTIGENFCYELTAEK